MQYYNFSDINNRLASRDREYNRISREATTDEQLLAALQQRREQRRAISSTEREDILARRRERYRSRTEAETDEQRQTRFVVLLVANLDTSIYIDRTSMIIYT